MHEEAAQRSNETVGNGTYRKLDSLNIVDIAALLEEMEEVELVKAFRMLPKDQAADVFSYLDSEAQQGIIEAITNTEIARIVNDLFIDDALDFIEEMPAGVVKKVLANTHPETRGLLNQFLQYPDDSVGSIMTVEFVDFKDGMDVTAAFSHIRTAGIDKETIYTGYVIDSQRHLLGSVSVRSLFMAEPHDLLIDIMDTDLVFTHTHDDRQTLANRFRLQGLMAIPVVDREQRLVGIVTFDDALWVQEEEDTEDFEIMAALVPAEESYHKTSIIDHSKNRLPWLFLLNLSVFLTGAIVAQYEAQLAVMPVLVTFLPMLMDTSGDAGSQSSTLVIRGMALEEITMKDVLPVLWKETRVSLTVGLAMAVVNFARIMLFGQGADMAFVVSVALLSAIVFSKVLGAMLPLGARVVKMDPAVMAGPVLTTVVDATSLLVFFSMARLVLSI